MLYPIDISQIKNSNNIKINNRATYTKNSKNLKNFQMKCITMRQNRIGCTINT